MKTFSLAILSCLCVISCSNSDSVILELETGVFKMSINDKGSITHFTDLQTNENYLSSDTISYLLSLRINGVITHPASATSSDNSILLNYQDNIEANIKVEEKASHLTFELLSLSNNDSVDLIIWGPYHNTIDKIIGETVGVVRGEEFALGIQALNIKTLGGYPWNESDRMPAFDIFKEDDPNNLHPGSDGSVLYRIEAAKPSLQGSSLQAYCRNRFTDRIVQDFNHDKLVAPAFDDGGVIGSKIALFGCPVEDALSTIGTIEIEEGLPHPTLDGQWTKIAPEAASAYLIMAFTEDNVDEAIALTKRAGLKYLYHYGKTFESWGHFDLFKGEFPSGMAGLRTCVEKAEAEGIKIGTHFLSNFVSTTDAYVTPVPHEGLAKVGSSVITEDIDASQTEIVIESPEFFNQMKNNNLKTVVIDNELIRYGNVSDEAPWRLLDCQRGAFNTTASAHNSGTEISKLLDHGYKVFLTNTDLTVEMSKTMADLYNQTGLRQISFDGLEGNRSTGLGTYGESMMPYVWYNNLSDELKDHLIIDASRTTHFFWHIYTRMNWGEPWYGGFRESQTEYRMNNQPYFKRNFMPGMLGWFKMTPETSIEDMEWLLTRSAAYDAGYAFVVGEGIIEQNGNSEKILALIGEWERARIGGAFSDEQKEIMKDLESEFSLTSQGENEWSLRRVYSGKFKHEKKVMQPGEPLYSTFDFRHTGEDQSINFILSAVEADISDIILEIDNYKEITLPTSLTSGQTIKYTGGDNAQVYNSTWQVIREIDIDASNFKISEGGHTLTFDCQFRNAGKDALAKFEIRTFDRAEKITLPTL